MGMRRGCGREEQLGAADRTFMHLVGRDIENAVRCSQLIGDDYLQKKSQGYTVPDAFTHGTSAQRERWLTRGLKSGNLKDGNTYNLSDSEL